MLDKVWRTVKLLLCSYSRIKCSYKTSLVLYLSFVSWDMLRKTLCCTTLVRIIYLGVLKLTYNLWPSCNVTFAIKNWKSGQYFDLAQVWYNTKRKAEEAKSNKKSCRWLQLSWTDKILNNILYLKEIFRSYTSKQTSWKVSLFSYRAACISRQTNYESFRNINMGSKA